MKNLKQIVNLSILTLTAISLNACLPQRDANDGSSEIDFSSLEVEQSFQGPGSVYEVDFLEQSKLLVRKYNDDYELQCTVHAEVESHTTGFESWTALNVVEAAGNGCVSDEGNIQVGDSAKALKVDGVAMIFKFFKTEEVRYAVLAGGCPNTDLSSNWIVGDQRDSCDASNNNPSSACDWTGTFEWSSGIEQATLPSTYTLNGTSLGASSIGPAVCQDGVIEIMDQGSVEARMFLTEAGAAIVHTGLENKQDRSFIIALNKEAIAASDLAGDYAGLVFDENNKNNDGNDATMPVQASINAAGTVLTGDALEDIATGEIKANEGAIINLSNFNIQEDGTFDGSMNGDIIKCMADVNVLGEGKNVIFCVGQSPGEGSKFYNFLLISK